MTPYQGRETCFTCLKEEKEQAQPQLYGTPYFSVRIALTGQPVSLSHLINQGLHYLNLVSFHEMPLNRVSGVLLRRIRDSTHLPLDHPAHFLRELVQ